MDNIFEDSSEYVCITHRRFIPCDEGDRHLISNWEADVTKIKKLMEKGYGYYT